LQRVRAFFISSKPIHSLDPRNDSASLEGYPPSRNVEWINYFTLLKKKYRPCINKNHHLLVMRRITICAFINHPKTGSCP
jgi:hypothetical protein